MSSFEYQHIPVNSDVEFIDRSSAELEQAISDAVAEKGSCTLGLSGGSTPRPIYEMLGKLVAVEWDKVTVFLVDDRYIPEGDDDSNQKLVRNTLLKSASIPEHQIIFPDTSLPLEECIEDYDRRIEDLGAPDVITLGLGEDGHIASLFPGDVEALTEEQKHVLHTTTDKFAVRDRITVTAPVLVSSLKQFFFLKGESKKKIFAKVISENVDPMEYPAHTVLDTGKSVWLTWW